MRQMLRVSTTIHDNPTQELFHQRVSKTYTLPDVIDTK